MPNTDEFAILRKDPFSTKIDNFNKLINTCNKLTFLIGAGCSACADLPLIRGLTTRVLAHNSLSQTDKQILNVVKDSFAGSQTSHIEHYISEIVDWLAIAQRRASQGVGDETIEIGGESFTVDELRETTYNIKKAIACITQTRSVSIDTHKNFVHSVHVPVRPGRPNSQIPIDYLVLNYDTLLEDALALEQVTYTDGFEGGVTAWWREEKFEQGNWEARVFKLHGSIDWYKLPDDPLPRRVNTTIEMLQADNLPILIWPSSTKYQESQLDPFAQLMDHARHVLDGQQIAQRLLVICGYSFGDDHINLEIDKALREHSAELNVAVFTSEDEPVGQVEDWHHDPAVTNRVSIFANGGFYCGDSQCLAAEELKWWKFENVTRILGGQL